MNSNKNLEFCEHGIATDIYVCYSCIAQQQAENEVIIRISIDEANELCDCLSEQINNLNKNMTDYDVKAAYSDSAWNDHIKYQLESQDILYKIKRLIENQLYEDESE